MTTDLTLRKFSVILCLMFQVLSSGVRSQLMRWMYKSVKLSKFLLHVLPSPSMVMSIHQEEIGSVSVNCQTSIVLKHQRKRGSDALLIFVRLFF